VNWNETDFCLSVLVQQRSCFSLNWSSSAHSHVGWIFASEERKTLVPGVFDMMAQVQALFMMSLIQTIGCKKAAFSHIFRTYKHCFLTGRRRNQVNNVSLYIAFILFLTAGPVMLLWGNQVKHLTCVCCFYSIPFLTLVTVGPMVLLGLSSPLMLWGGHVNELDSQSTNFKEESELQGIRIFKKSPPV